MKLPIRIILVDDHNIIIDGLRSLFETNQDILIVETFNSASQAFSYLQSNHTTIDVIISDISLQGMTGIDFCKKVKEYYSDIKVIFLTMYNSKEIVREAIMSESDGYLLKSADTNLLQNAILKVYNNGTYYSEEIIPIISSYYENNRVKKETIIILTEREREILTLIASDLTSEEIASQLFISVKTVGHHRQHLLAKTRCRSSIGLVKFAIEIGLV